MARPVLHEPNEEAGAPLARLLVLASRQLADDLQDRLDAAGFRDLRLAHHQVLANLPPGGLRLTALAERARMTKQAMAELVADLVELGYLACTPDPDDRRAKRIELSARGRRSVAATVAASAAMEQELAQRITPKHVRQLRRALLGTLEEHP
jgi:DNA-binding MarR family transcriptional regulator